MTERLVVIGGDAAGMSAASVARRRRGADQLSIVAFERGEYSSFSACGLPYYVGDDVHRTEQLVARTPEQHRANEIDLRMRHEVLAIDVDQRRVRVRDLDSNSEFDQPFDQLLIATGASPARPSWPGIDADGVYGLHTIPDAVAVRERIEAGAPARAVVVGGGYVGLEMAEALLARGLEVVVVHRGSQPMASLDVDAGARVAAAMRASGIDLRLGTSVEGFEVGSDDRLARVLTDRGPIEAGLAVLGVGIRPNVALAVAAGIPTGPSGGIVTDGRMATPIDGVWAAGDCAETRHRVSGQPVVVALGTHANQQGRVVGANATGGDVRFPGVIGTAITKFDTTEIARTGLSEHECREHGIDSIAATIESTTRAGYYPGAAPIAVKVVAARGSGRVLGGQIVGGVGAGKRIDVLALAVWNEMTAAELSQADLAYAPPFSPVFDPVLVAARQVAAQV